MSCRALSAGSPIAGRDEALAIRSTSSARAMAVLSKIEKPTKQVEILRFMTDLQKKQSRSRERNYSRVYDTVGLASVATICVRMRGNAFLKGHYQQRHLLELDCPVRRIQELFPRAVALIGQTDVDHRAALRLDRLGDQMQVRLIRRAAALFHVAPDAAADDVFPRTLAPLALGNDV